MISTTITLQFLRMGVHGSETSITGEKFYDCDPPPPYGWVLNTTHTPEANTVQPTLHNTEDLAGGSRLTLLCWVMILLFVYLALSWWVRLCQLLSHDTNLETPGNLTLTLRLQSMDGV